MQVVESAVEFVLVLKQAALEVHKKVVIDRKHNFSVFASVSQRSNLLIRQA